MKNNKNKMSSSDDYQVKGSKKESDLDSKELSIVESFFPRNQRPLHIVLKADIRYMKKIYNNAIIALTPHFIGIFIRTKSDMTYENLDTIHISSIHRLTVRSGKSVIVKTDETNLAMNGKKTTKFAQLLYRNYFLSYTLIDPSDELDVRTDDESLFPEIELPVSLSQVFQFYYFVGCTGHEVKYNHDVVRYVHSMITSKNTILDASLLPTSFYHGKSAKANLLPLFDTLNAMKTLAGVCIYNFECPDAITAFASIISYCPSIKIVHFSNCNATDGLAQLAKSVSKSKEFGVAYWDLSYNKLKEFQYFPKIIKCSDSPIYYLNLNYCDINADCAKLLFNALEDFKYADQMTYLSIARINLSTESALSAFHGFLKVSNLQYLDISSINEEISPILKLVVKECKLLETLILNNATINEGALYLLNSFIKSSTTLKELSLNNTNIDANDVAAVINTILDNSSIKSMSLHLDHLSLNGKNLKIVLDTLSKGKLSKWRLLSFSSNSLNNADLKKIIATISELPKLRAIKLDDNFDRSMEGIGKTLQKLLDAKSLVSISIIGSKNHRLHSELIPFLKKVSEIGTIEELDIRDNGAKDKTIPFIVEVMNNCKNLSLLRCDGNDFSDIEKLVEAIPQARNLITFNFPISDCEKIVSKDDRLNKPEFVETLVHLQTNAVDAINNNRNYLKLPCELPFETTYANPQIEDLIADLTAKSRKRLRYNLDDLTTHSCVGEVLGLPYPFQKSNDKLKKLGTFEKIKLGKMKVYDAPSMGEIISENDPIYPEFFDSPTLGMNLEDVFFDILIDNPTKESKKSRKTIDNEKDTPIIQRSKRLLFERRDSDSDDERARIQFGQANLVGVDKGPMHLKTRNVDPGALDDLMYDFTPAIYANAREPNAPISKEAPPLYRKSPKLVEKKGKGNTNRGGFQTLDEKQKNILDTGYAMSSSDQEHIEMLKQLNLQGDQLQLTSSDEQDHPSHHKKPSKKKKSSDGSYHHKQFEQESEGEKSSSAQNKKKKSSSSSSDNEAAQKQKKMRKHKKISSSPHSDDDDKIIPVRHNKSQNHSSSPPASPENNEEDLKDMKKIHRKPKPLKLESSSSDDDNKVQKRSVELEEKPHKRPTDSEPGNRRRRKHQQKDEENQNDQKESHEKPSPDSLHLDSPGDKKIKKSHERIQDAEDEDKKEQVSKKPKGKSANKMAHSPPESGKGTRTHTRSKARPPSNEVVDPSAPKAGRSSHAIDAQSALDYANNLLEEHEKKSTEHSKPKRSRKQHSAK